MRLANTKCAGEAGPISLVAKVSSRTASQAGIASGSGLFRASTLTRRQFDRQCLVRRFDVDPGQAIAEKILSLAAALRFRADLQCRDLDALAVTIDRHLPKHMARVRHRRSVGVGVDWRTS
jgi:hypothetical protein